MTLIFKDWLRSIGRFLADKYRRRVLLLAVLCLIALVEFFALGLARRTFVFYTVDNGKVTVEDRLLKRASSREGNLTRYVEEALLGPVAPDLLPLFPRETRLGSLLFRDGVVYADLSPEAVLPPEEGGVVVDSFRTLNEGILRNFSFVRDVRFFISGNAAYVDGFRL
ncbi:MAG: GerMN domain-containing protein [Treponema sp.]|nr:GerMN domain-containing protein [Treponema sp.]